MKYFELDAVEQEQLDAVESGEFKSVKNIEEFKKSAAQAAKNTLNKTTNINIRLSERDVYKLKARAAREGLPYQTLVSSILHQSV